MNSPQIIVGVDGSPAAGAAVAWAAEEAVRFHRDLVLVNVYDWRVVGSRAAIGGPYAEAAKARADEVLAEAVAHARSVAPEVSVRGEAVVGSVVPTLLGTSTPDSLVVLGNRGRGGFANLLLGSVTQQLATHASGPVVVVRGRTGSTGAVVVGTDGSDSARHAVGIAFEEAYTRGARLVAVRAYTMPRSAVGAELAAYVEPRPEREGYEQQGLDEDLAPWIEKYPTVRVQREVIEGQPADVLMGFARTAQLVVLGTRGHGGFTGLLLGSVAQQLMHHAESPLLIAR